MKILFKILTAFFLTSSLLAGCKKEDKLMPSPEPENVYGDHTLPQGNHPYDADIVHMFQKYNTMFLYKYVPKDLYYQIGDYTAGVYDALADKTVKAGYFDVPANEAFIGKQLDLLKDLWLKYYPDALLKAALPKKVYLLDSFYFAYNGAGKPLDNWPEFYDTYQGADFFAVTWGGTRIDNITAAEKYLFKSIINSMFLKLAHEKGAIKRAAAFTALTDYSALTFNNYWDYGVIDWYNRSPDQDWQAFMKMIVSTSYSKLTSPGNFLHSDWDTKGLIKKKYDVMIAYFQNVFGIDLQAIGNAGS